MKIHTAHFEGKSRPKRGAREAITGRPPSVGGASQRFVVSPGLDPRFRG